MKKFSIITIILMVFLCFGIQCTQTSKEVIPVTVMAWNDVIIVKGTLNGKIAYFLIDSGCSSTTLDENVAKYYRFECEQETGGETFGIGGAVANKLTSNVEIKVGSINFSMQAHCFDLSAVINNISSETNLRIAGIIGNDVLTYYSANINYSRKEISFE